MSFSSAERRALLTETFELKRRYHDYQVGRDPQANPQVLTDRLSELFGLYRAGLPRVPLSRCPFCSVVAVRSFDPFGLDGLWWDFDGPVRAISQPECPHQFAFTGAVQLNREQLEHTPHIVVPGPEVPFVVPRMLRGQPVRAVVSRIAVGTSTAYPIFYFADPAPKIERINTWGTKYYSFVGPDGGSLWGEVEPVERDYDFELAPWLDAGQLSYIAPDDATLTLRNGAAECPYVGLPGRRDIMRVYKGRCWSDPDELDP